MARPTKKSIDYFPLDCSPNDSIKYVEAKHGIVGYAILVKLWSKIYSSDGYYCYWNDKAKYLFCKENGIELTEIEEILETCFSENIFDSDKLKKFKILTSIGIQKRYFKIIKEARRKDIEITPDFCIKGVNTYINSINAGNNSVNSGKNPEETPQRKINKRKLNKTKLKGNNDTPISEDLKSESSEEAIEEKEKSSAKKEKRELTNCRDYFLSNASGYYWEEQDHKALGNIIEKINHSFGENLNEEEIEQNFQLFIQHLPKYWRTKKFTLTHLDRNFNEIINEIQNQNNGTAKEKFGRHSIDELADRASTFGR